MCTSSVGGADQRLDGLEFNCVYVQLSPFVAQQKVSRGGRPKNVRLQVSHEKGVRVLNALRLRLRVDSESP